MSAKSSDEVLAADGDHADDSFDALLRRAAQVSEPAGRGAALLPAGTALAGGRLSVLRRIGEGGMGVVYEAHDAQRKGRVALKTLTRIDAAGVYRLKNEFRALADVRHENLVALHELFSTEQAWFFTMDLIDGERFDRWVRPGTAAHDEARLRAALPQLVAGVNAVHAAGKLHRDLKPSNVLVTPDGRVVVLDFGLSVDPELGGVGQTVADESVSGTPAYMAPEQAAGRAATAESDFYAIGAMVFEALTGRLPFEGRTGEIIAAKQTREAPRAGALAGEVPADLEALCAGLLARDPVAWREAIAQCMQVTGRASTAPRPAPTTAARDAAPALLGRDPQLAALREAFAATLAGHPVVQFVAGESGMGKSALVSAFVEELRAQGRATVLAGRCYERENVPYKGFDALVDELSRHLRKLPEREAAALLPREVYALARIFPVLDRISVVADAPKKNVPDPQDLKQRAFAAFGELVARMRDRSPLVLVIDDLQWIDQDSMRFMRALLVHPEPPPVLVLCVHRSEGAAENALLQAVVEAAHDNAGLDVRRLALAALPQHALAALARRWLPSGAEAGAAEALAAEAQGSPFFAAELARAAPLHAGGAKLSLAEALSLHVASLPAEAQRLLSLLALAGEPLAPQLAVDAAGLSDGHAQLDRLRGEQLVRVSFDGDGGRTVECYHDKIREQVTAALDSLRTQELALGLSRALLAQPSADAELLARVLELAARLDQAAEHAARAAELAFAALAFERAATLYGKALAHGRFEPARLHALHVARAEALAHAGRGPQAAEAFLEAASGAQGDAALALTRRAGEQYLMCGEDARSYELLVRTLPRMGIAFPRSLGAAVARLAWTRTRLRLRGLHYTPRMAHDPTTLRELELLGTMTYALVRSDMVRGAEFGARWLLRALDAGHEVMLGRALGWEIFFASNMGVPADRIETVRALAASLAERTQDPLAAMNVGYATGFDRLWRLADPAATAELMERGLELMRAHPIAAASYDRAWHVYWLATSRMACGTVAAGMEIAAPEFEQVVARGDKTVGAFLAALVCEGYLAADRPEQAARAIESAGGHLGSGDVTLQDFIWVYLPLVTAIYRGDARTAWYAMAQQRERVLRSSLARYVAPGLMELNLCGYAAAVARQAETVEERKALERVAVQLAKRARRARYNLSVATPAAVLACVRSDRAGAIAALRQRLQEPITPAGKPLLCRRLGELLGGAEGAALVAEADAALRARGVVDPARYTAAMVPGVELPPSRPQLGSGSRVRV